MGKFRRWRRFDFDGWLKRLLFSRTGFLPSRSLPSLVRDAFQTIAASTSRQNQVFYIFFIVFFVILLSSCSSKVAKRDGAPDFYVDETRIPNAVPKPEPLAKYGNMPSYVVFGKRYYTKKSSRYYDEIGTASWYGTQFHARNTSSGEPYNMLAMTAAHKTLPLPTYVEVTNLNNHKKIIVKVNDRGPFASNRIIDLSYVAAKKLGMAGHGTARVRVRAIDPHAPKHFPAFRPHYFSMKKSPSLYLQVGAFREKTHAENLQKRLTAELNAPVQISRGKLYRVKVGPFKDVSSANKVDHHLKSMGISANKINEM